MPADRMTPQEREEKAKENFLKGYNCTQSILRTYEDLLPEEGRSEIYRMCAGFGGGMGRLREVCGAVSGMFLLAGFLYGYEDTGANGEKAALYAKIQTLAKRFEEENGTIICRELLGLTEKRQDPKPEERTAEYYAKRPCPEKIGCAARLFAEFMEEQEGR